MSVLLKEQLFLNKNTYKYLSYTDCMKEYFKVLNFFLDNPFKEFYLREIAKKLNISSSVSKKYLDLFSNKEFFIESKKVQSRFFKLNLENLQVKYLKIAHNFEILKDQRILDQILNKKKLIISVVLFGSFAKGLNDEKSDIDIIIVGSSEYVDIESKQEVSIKSFTWAEWKKQKTTNQAFYEEVIQTGIALYGDLPKL